MKDNKELSEKDFIHEEYSQHPFTIWGWLAAVVAFTLLIWGGISWYTNSLERQYIHSPFLQVTNREMSLFLWQNPSFMRVNAKNKNGYLSSFQYIDKIGLNPEYAEDYAAAPPEVLFYYHTWHRLIKKEFALRNIPAKEFQNFLAYVEEWQPRYWAQAPAEYITLVNELPQLPEQDLNQLPENVLPLEVRQAFIGWKNYFIEGNEINNIRPRYKEMADFIKKYPHYAHNFWRNIVGESYLTSLRRGNYNPDAIIPDSELSSFLKVAFYNYRFTIAKPSS